MKLVPLEDHVILEASSEQEKTKGGVFLPDTADKGKPEQGTIISVGPGKRMENGQIALMEVKVGDRVLFTKYGPDEIEVEGKKYLIARQSDILAIIK